MISDENLDKIAVAFGEQPGYFTAPRPVDPAGGSSFLDRMAHTEVVQVRHLTTQPHVRELAGCQGFMVNAPGLDHLKPDINALVEWLDLASFILSPHSGSDEGRRRELYSSILQAVTDLEAKGVTVLAGILHRPRYGIEDWKTVVLNVTSKKTDPGALKRTFVLVDVQAFDDATMAA